MKILVLIALILHSMALAFKGFYVFAGILYKADKLDLNEETVAIASVHTIGLPLNIFIEVVLFILFFGL